MGVMRAISCFWLRNVAKVPPLLNLMPCLATSSKALGKTGRCVPVLSGRAEVYQSVCKHKLTHGSETNARSSIISPICSGRADRGMQVGAPEGGGSSTGRRNRTCRRGHAGRRSKRPPWKLRSKQLGSARQQSEAPAQRHSAGAKRAGQLCREARRHPLGHRQGLFARSLVLAGNLAGQSAGSQPTLDLSGRHSASGVSSMAAADRVTARR